MRTTACFLSIIFLLVSSQVVAYELVVHDTFTDGGRSNGVDVDSMIRTGGSFSHPGKRKSTLSVLRDRIEGVHLLETDFNKIPDNADGLMLDMNIDGTYRTPQLVGDSQTIQFHDANHRLQYEISAERAEFRGRVLYVLEGECEIFQENGAVPIMTKVWYQGWAQSETEEDASGKPRQIYDVTWDGKYLYDGKIAIRNGQPVVIMDRTLIRTGNRGTLQFTRITDSSSGGLVRGRTAFVATKDLERIFIDQACLRIGQADLTDLSENVRKCVEAMSEQVRSGDLCAAEETLKMLHRLPHTDSIPSVSNGLIAAISIFVLLTIAGSILLIRNVICRRQQQKGPLVIGPMPGRVSQSDHD